MNAGWEVGDLALCVSRDERHAPVVQVGETYIVECIWDGVPQTDTLEPGICFDLVGVPRWGDECCYAPEHFRKIKPDAHESCEDEFVTLLKRSKVSA
jgi:hypothetical protein